jgi:hypothetical protein
MLTVDLVDRRKLVRIKITGTALLGFILTVSSFPALSADGRSPDLKSTSLAVKMTAFEMPPEYECPLFSNSPYSDMLTALDKMQENLNSVFPQCENKTANTKLNETSDLLHKKVLETQSLQETGQTFRLNQNAVSIVDLTRTLQQSLVSVSNIQTKACYRSEAQFRNVIFSINDTFQSLSPLILDLATKNPALSQTLGPALKIFAGADSISKGLSLIEQIAKDSVQFDMTDKDNRINTVKNTCQFMKLYNRLSYLRLSRLGQVQSIHTKFQSEINEMNQKLSQVPKTERYAESSREVLPEMSMPRGAAFPMQLRGGNESGQEYFSMDDLKNTLPAQQGKIQMSLADFDQAKEDNFPEITRCQIVTSNLHSETMQRELRMIRRISSQYKLRGDDVLSEFDVIHAYQNDLDKAISSGDKKQCTLLGQDWLRKIDHLFVVGRQIIAAYEVQQLDLNGEDFVLKQKTLNKQTEKLKSVESDYNNLKTMLTYAAFESSEVEKRAKGMPKFLFAGPDKVVSECQNRSADNKCGLGEKIAGIAKSYYQEYRNQGPVYELLLNNENYFNDSIQKMKTAMKVIRNFEDQYYGKAMPSQAFSSAKAYQDFIVGQDKHSLLMKHLNSTYLVKGSANHTSICTQAKVVVNEYLKATNHMMSTYGLCEMIKNVLKEPEVSAKLRNYCLPRSNDQDSNLNKLRYQLTGQFSETERSEFYIKKFESSPKVFVDTLLERMDELGCYEN